MAFPHLPGNTRTIDEVGEVKIDQVVIGSCTNGFYKDIEEAASIIRGKKVAKNVRAIIIPATQAIYLKAMENGLLKDFIEAGCVVSTRPAVRVWADTWAFWLPANVQFPPQTGTS